MQVKDKRPQVDLPQGIWSLAIGARDHKDATYQVESFAGLGLGHW